MRIPACLGALVRSPCRAGSGILHRYIHRQGQRPLTTLNLFARSCSLHRVVRPHTTSHAASRARQVCGFSSRSFVTRALRLAPCSRVSNVQNGTHWTLSLCCSRDCYATRWRNITARALALARRNGFRTVRVHGALRASRFYVILAGGTSVEKRWLPLGSHRDC